MAQWLTIIGIGEDGYGGLGQNAREALGRAETVFGGKRHLELLPSDIMAERIAWPMPFSDAYPMLRALRGQPVVVLASGDPMHFGMGATLTRFIEHDEMQILSAPSSFSLAAAAMGWPIQDLQLLSVHGRPVESLFKAFVPGARLLVLSNDGDTPTQVARMLSQSGFQSAHLTVLEHMGGGAERRIEGVSGTWNHPRCADLNVLAVDCGVPTSSARAYSVLAGLPDEAFENDGQLTKRDIRAVTLAHLGPLPGELLWDVGAGCGSISIEWMRTHAACRALAIEANENRQGLILRNSRALGVPDLQIVCGEAPAALTGLAVPDAIFIGGGVTDEGVMQTCWQSLKPGGRLVANAVTIQSEVALVGWREVFGGDLTKLTVSHAQPLGSFDAWRAALPVTIYSVRKPD
ncbi:precorrin-6y C5,15-methyltransferase (decarboxylating) subunit CbiE [Phyllobacterium sp. A18/5-2]|jgi:precorrin-6B C5,15-methyltransferase / cobalt-precorrin-6B C5,C15-methyltransferase|uniref:precorrin-6y C5,15-methyltransferase (decarboxylating) subunit CbiE n=1 Tax=Phyllobacterium sp. A18/5-2 TaxID=2978392 RepID=UPI0021C9109B|nr:precorrin-6y C5,15-methyltransferase (decarboxylating) subunit CbiE [Phyllobacterium sp. A18/5-2]UXN65023.1 precorrin-6y C5,15-methyltransferase (decarboxylating) subunit CbiE [Phyllobacterium sp. A18/5-2]